MAKPENWGVTKNGFYCPTYSEIITEKAKTARLLFGEDIDTGEQTALGKFIRISAKDEQRLYSEAEALYYSRFPDTATGINLDRICKLAGCTRKPASCARHTVSVCGTDGHIIPAGTRFKNDSGKIFWSLKTEIIDKKDLINDNIYYYADIPVECETAGTAGNVNNINSLVEVDTDVMSVEYQGMDVAGEEIETDAALRKRFDAVTKGLGSNTAATIVAALIKLAYVNDAFVIENNTVESKAVSEDLVISPRSYAVIVHADDDSHTSDIAKTIFSKQPLGIVQSGTTEEILQDDSGESHLIRFSYVEKTKVDIEITCRVSAYYNEMCDAELQKALREAINSLGIGNSVIYSALYKPVYSVRELEEVVELKLNGSTENIPIARNKVAEVGNITITHVEGN